MGRRSTGFVELHHTHRLGQGGEPLRAPLTLIIRGLIADLDLHLVCLFVYLFSLQGQGQRLGEAVTVHPLSYAVWWEDSSA